MKLVVTFVLGLALSVTAAPTSTSYEIHEKREFTNPVWIPRDIRLAKSAVIPISIGLRQQNLENGHDFLMDVSDPTSPNYSNHWSPENV
jgi:tripeptidyl-peptidase I